MEKKITLPANFDWNDDEAIMNLIANHEEVQKSVEDVQESEEEDQEQVRRAHCCETHKQHISRRHHHRRRHHPHQGPPYEVGDNVEKAERWLTYVLAQPSFNPTHGDWERLVSAMETVEDLSETSTLTEMLTVDNTAKFFTKENNQHDPVNYLLWPEFLSVFMLLPQEILNTHCAIVLENVDAIFHDGEYYYWHENYYELWKDFVGKLVTKCPTGLEEFIRNTMIPRVVDPPFDDIFVNNLFMLEDIVEVNPVLIKPFAKDICDAVAENGGWKTPLEENDYRRSHNTDLELLQKVVTTDDMDTVLEEKEVIIAYNKFRRTPR